MEDLKETEIEKLRQIISRTDKSGNEKLLLLMDFIYTRESAICKADVNKCVDNSAKATLIVSVEDIKSGTITITKEVAEFLKTINGC